MSVENIASEVTSARKSQSSGQVQSLKRALSLLNALAAHSEGMTLTELAQAVGLPPSTAHRLLTTLESERYVRFEPGEHLWQVGVQAFVSGNAFLRSRDIARMSRRFMRRLMEESGETANLYVHEGGEAVCLGQVESRQLMRAISRPGGKVKMHCSGAGKAILAHMRREELETILGEHGMPRITAHTITDRAALDEDLERIRSRGFSVDDGEHAIGLRCVASPIFDENARPLAALSLSGPTARIHDDGLERLGRLVRAIAAEITRDLGGILPRPRGD
ncbi:MAG: helix-turn-helix domain-containing protein [Geminicoccaceae bacterium]|nr:helix-turn-helix domain-containing protein [Geminicoccaceae bacterium]